MMNSLGPTIQATRCEKIISRYVGGKAIRGAHPARQTETLGQTVNQNDIVFVDVDDVIGG